ncbi:hypothetical protein JCM15765_22840 [Paradesulfitobacterium aromaticivorans]
MSLFIEWIGYISLFISFALGIADASYVLMFLAIALRQLTVWWHLQGLWQYFRREKAWGQMARKGFNA